MGKSRRRAGKKKARKKIKINLPKELKPSKFPKIIHPQLAVLVDEPPVGNEWLHEIKLDGYRLLIFKYQEKIKLFTRNGHDWTAKFQSLVASFKNLSTYDYVIDGEVTVLDNKQHSNFQLLQNAIKKNQGRPFIFYAFDLLYIDHFNITHLALIERKEILSQLIPKNSELIRYSDHIIGSGKKVFASACRLGLEGIVSKKILSPYVQKRMATWLKIKCTQRQEFIIGGYTPPQGNRKFFGSLLLGTYNKKGELIYHGNVGTGFTESSLKNLYSALQKHFSPTMPFHTRPPASTHVKWVKPVLVCEVEFTEWTGENALRHPSFKGLRNDKMPKEIRKEKTKHLTQKNILTTEFKISHPQKIVYAENKISKEEIANYYLSIEKWIMPYITDRALTIVRCPSGYKECFYQKHTNKTTPHALKSIEVKEKNSLEPCIYIDDLKGLMALVQIGTLEIHPWGSRIQKIDYPDMLIFDLDPGEDVSWHAVVETAFEIKFYFSQLKLISFVKTTGGKGLHVVIPIKAQYQWDEIKHFTHRFVDALVTQKPKQYIAKMAKADRKGKIYIDYLRNQRGATAIAPYSTRARKYAPVATPLAWNELTEHFEDTFYTIETIEARLAKLKKDPWADFFKLKQSLNLEKLKK